MLIQASTKIIEIVNRIIIGQQHGKFIAADAGNFGGLINLRKMFQTAGNFYQQAIAIFMTIGIVKTLKSH